MFEEDITAYLAENPKMIGVLFTICLLIVKGSTAAAAGTSYSGGP